MTAAPHISDATLAALAARGWNVKGMHAGKLMSGMAPAGQLSNGARAARIAFDPTGRWLEGFDGWHVAFEMDSRDWTGRPDAFAAEIEERAIKVLRSR